MPPPAPAGPAPDALPPVIVKLLNVTDVPAPIFSVRPAPCASSVAEGEPVTLTLTGAVNVPTHVPLTETLPPADSAV
jgi:hypothetical protein